MYGYSSYGSAPFGVAQVQSGTGAGGGGTTTPPSSGSGTTTPPATATIDATKVSANRVIAFPGNKRVVTFPGNKREVKF